MAEAPLKAPFPWFGGKSRAAPLILPRLGACPNYIEPFAGSLAVLLAKEPSRYETVNDLDCYIANFWRAVTADPERVAYHADWPVNEACLTARHRWLMAAWRKHKFKRRMLCDAEYYDPLVAGWWVWGISCWIGAGWCDERSEWNGPGGEGNRGRAMHQEPKRPEIGNCQGVGSNALREPSPTPEMMVQTERGTAGARTIPEQIPRLGGPGGKTGVHKDSIGIDASGVRPDLASDGKGVHQQPPKKRPHLHNDQGTSLAHAPGKRRPSLSRARDVRMVAQSVPEGRPHLQRPYGVHKPSRNVSQQVPNIGYCAGRGVNPLRGFGRRHNEALLDWMRRLAERLRYVRVCCGDWSRVMGKAVRTAATPTAIFFDPPYSAEADRHDGIYAVEDTSVAHDVRKWCIKHGVDPRLRIALCGYEGEGHDVLVEDHGWTVESWTASGGYGRIHGEEQGRSLVNRYRERVYFSPACLQGWEGSPLFAAAREEAGE